MELHTIGIDLGKTVFPLVGLNLRGEVVVRKKFSRLQLLPLTANRQVQLIGMEVCGGFPFSWPRTPRTGHQVRLIPAQYVMPYVKTNKSDYIDAEAVTEAVGDPRSIVAPTPQGDTGLVTASATVHNQRGELVLSGEHKYQLRRQD
jgi:transposase